MRKASSAAREMRTKRRSWATPGGRHDRLVGILNIALPSSVGVLAAFLAMAPLQQSNELNFLVSKDNVEIAEERLRVESARYSGADAEGRPFEINAAGAVQRSSDVPVIEMEDLSAQIELDDGIAFIAANRGRFNMDDDVINVNGPIEFRAADGYALRTSDVDVDLNSRQMRANGDVSGRFPDGTFRADRMLVRMANRTVQLAGGVSGTIPLGRYSANRMRVDMANETVRLEGRARLRIDQGGSR